MSNRMTRSAKTGHGALVTAGGDSLARVSSTVREVSRPIAILNVRVDGPDEEQLTKHVMSAAHVRTPRGAADSLKPNVSFELKKALSAGLGHTRKLSRGASPGTSPSDLPRGLDTERKLAAVRGNRQEGKRAILTTRLSADKQDVVVSKPPDFSLDGADAQASRASEIKKTRVLSERTSAEIKNTQPSQVLSEANPGKEKIRRRPVVVVQRKSAPGADQTRRPLGLVIRTPLTETAQQSFGIGADDETTPYFFATPGQDSGQ